jgi:hypothetical protein
VDQPPGQLNEILGFFIPMGSGVKKGSAQKEQNPVKAVAHPADGEEVQQPPSFLTQSSLTCIPPVVHPAFSSNGSQEKVLPSKSTTQFTSLVSPVRILELAVSLSYSP